MILKFSIDFPLVHATSQADSCSPFMSAEQVGRIARTRMDHPMLCKVQSKKVCGKEAGMGIT